jgi:sulfotransferase family protein/putative peptidoglycan binding protein
MQDTINKPIFVVGSPRSGTSVLAWCLEQHPNIITLPESGWMGDLAIDLAIRYQIGAARGDRSVLSAMDIPCEEFFASFGRSVNDLILKHREDLERKRTIERAQRALKDQRFDYSEITREMSGDLTALIRWYQLRNGLEVNGQLNAETLRALEIPPSQPGPKTRWLDQTPEYSMNICGLRKLFPQALFIHIVREVADVVRSLLNFFPHDKNRLVDSEQAAYEYWLRRVSACVEAEQAYGPQVVYRMRYSALLGRSESAIRSLFDFLGETYTAKCLDPLGQRINTSNVPPDFKSDDPATDPAIIERAKKLSDELQNFPQQREASPAAAVEMEAAFEKRVQYVATVDSEYQRALRIITTLQKETAQLSAGCSDRKSDLKTE